MTGPTSRLMVYDGPVAIGEVEDHGRGRVIAYQHTATTRVKIGEFPDRVSAMRAIHVHSPEPRGAA